MRWMIRPCSLITNYLAAREMGEIVRDSAQELRQALRLRDMKDVFPHTRALHRLENRGDDVLRDAIDKLFSGRMSVAMALERHEVTVGGKPVSLSANEFDLLQEVWGEDYFGDTRTLDTHVGWLRKKVEDGGGVRIIAVRGLGYRLDLRD